MSLLNGVLNGVEQNTPERLVLGPLSISYDAKKGEPARRAPFKRVNFSINSFNQGVVEVSLVEGRSTQYLAYLQRAQAEKLAKNGSVRVRSPEAEERNESPDMVVSMRPEEGAVLASWLETAAASSSAPRSLPAPATASADARGSINLAALAAVVGIGALVALKATDKPK